MPNDGLAATSFRDVVVIGGGCYGSFYAGQLATARAHGKALFRRVIVVDHDPHCQAVREGRLAEAFELAVADWGAFLDSFLTRQAPAAGEPDDAIVPSPLMPHLMAEWLGRLAERTAPGRVTAVPASLPGRTPFDVLAPDGTRYLSHADWLCPTHCIEPHRCPVTSAPRTWEMADTVVDYARRLERVAEGDQVLGPALFVTRHRAFGVGMFDLAEVREARRVVEEAVRGGVAAVIPVGTLSACHGAVSLLRVGTRAAL